MLSVALWSSQAAVNRANMRLVWQLNTIVVVGGACFAVHLPVLTHL